MRFPQAAQRDHRRGASGELRQKRGGFSARRRRSHTAARLLPEPWPAYFSLAVRAQRLERYRCGESAGFAKDRLRDHLATATLRRLENPEAELPRENVASRCPRAKSQMDF